MSASPLYSWWYSSALQYSARNLQSSSISVSPKSSNCPMGWRISSALKARWPNFWDAVSVWHEGSGTKGRSYVRLLQQRKRKQDIHASSCLGRLHIHGHQDPNEKHKEHVKIWAAFHFYYELPQTANCELPKLISYVYDTANCELRAAKTNFPELLRELRACEHLQWFLG